MGFKPLSFGIIRTAWAWLRAVFGVQTSFLRNLLDGLAGSSPISKESRRSRVARLVWRWPRLSRSPGLYPRKRGIGGEGRGKARREKRQEGG